MKQPNVVPNRPAFLFFGVVLPTVALLLEVIWRPCAADLFDPAPTPWHRLLIGLVPAANCLAWFALKTPTTMPRNDLAFLNGLALGVSGFYTVLFLPTTPLGVVLSVFFGIGLLLLAPLAAFAAALAAHRCLRHRYPEGDPWRKTTRLGLACGLLCLVALEAPATLTRTGLHLAVSDDAATRQRGVRWLRSVGDEGLLLQACYRPMTYERDIIGYVLRFFSASYVGTEAARRVYYQVTGTAFNSVPPPATLRGAAETWWEAWDADRSGEEVGQRLRHVTLASSTIDGSVDADAALGYTEWTLVFRNASAEQQEARAQVKLPPGGVVTRVTLWVDGEAREAAFGERGRVREAYRQVVRRRRDPLLVTTSGPDRALVQCFPIPPGGEMQVRIGVTAPLALDGRTEAHLQLPYFDERNFDIPSEVRHQVWIESEQPMQVNDAALHVEAVDGRLHAVRGGLSDDGLASPDGVVWLARSEQQNTAWTPDPLNEAYVIRQRITEQPVAPPGRIAVVVDGSRSMEPFLSAIAEALPALAGTREVRVYFASDDVVTVYDAARGTPLTTAADRLRRLKAQGGRDNVPALEAAWDYAAERSASVILWIHGAQPVSLGTPGALLQRWTRRPGGPLLYELQAAPGRNVVVADLDEVATVRTVQHLGRLSDDLGWLFERLSKASERLLVERERAPRSATEALETDLTSAHLARLWAYEQVKTLAAARDEAAAIRLAVQYQLVTPVSGAVVLETQRQYDEAGLEPVAEGTVPTIPEPEVWLLLAIAGAVLLALAYGQKSGHGWRLAGGV